MTDPCHITIYDQLPCTSLVHLASVTLQTTGGFSAIALNFEDLVNGTATELSTLAALGYSYKLLRSANTTSVTPDVVIGESSSASAGLDLYVLGTVNVPGGSVSLVVERTRGTWLLPGRTVSSAISRRSCKLWRCCAT